ncbi:Reverse transcriptase zinc-binding domain - like 10 [Theobroma cacao]|nr:Reverse transcriptase zinc-binding domain - like 10 [Theobroma cacao]
MLSFGGRITLLKFVLTSMPVFFMSLFQVPHKVNELEKLQRFLWGGDEQKRKIHLVKWDKVVPNFGFAVGKGDNLLFWSDEWIDGIILSQAFSRIFTLTVNKNGKVVDFGQWEEDSWLWNDKIEKIWKYVWTGLAPFRVEAFVWQLMHGKIVVKDRLTKRDIGEADFNLTEYRAIREAFAIFAASKWKEDYSLLIESDSCNVAPSFHPLDVDSVSSYDFFLECCVLLVPVPSTSGLRPLYACCVPFRLVVLSQVFFFALMS